MIASVAPPEQDEFIRGLSDHAVAALPYLFEFWALDHQMPPEGDWRTWVIVGGRGSGKTRAGAEWVRRMAEGPRPVDRGAARRIALVGETLDQVRDVMIFGESGILAVSPPDRRPIWEATRRRLLWPNGAIATAYSAQEPESLRGPQFDAAWSDELAKWRKADQAWDILQFCLRLGPHPRQCVTTTPRRVDVLKRILGVDSTVVTRASTEANRANLPKSFLDEIRARYGDTRLGRQEIEGLFLEDIEGALWTSEMLDRARLASPPALDRIVVAVDPPVTKGRSADACGIVVAGVRADDEGLVVLEDASVHGASPSGWARRAVETYHRHQADRMVIEVNQGGDLVEQVVRQIDHGISYRSVHASRGKAARAEPVAALYEQGRVSHLPGLGKLESQMCQMTPHGYQGKGSPDRVDALVWAVHDLALRDRARMSPPRVRTLG